MRDVLGKELYAKRLVVESNDMIIKFEDGFYLSPGVYTITISNSESAISKRIVIR